MVSSTNRGNVGGVIEKARSFLFVPGDRPERLPKALSSGAHAVIIDLEDAVAPEERHRARDLVATSLARFEDRSRVLVRINASGTPWHDDDIELVSFLRIAGIVVPKAEDVSRIDRIGCLAAAPVLALVESAEGVFAVDRIAQARSVARIAFGHIDFQLDLGMHIADDERELDSIRLAIALGSRRAGLPPPVDGVTTALDDTARLHADTARSHRLGFRGKLCIHPKQVDIVNGAFAPNAAQIAWARRVTAAAAAVESTGAFCLDGQMIDAPVVQRAQALLAEGCA